METIWPKLLAVLGLIVLAGLGFKAIRDFRNGHVTERGRILGQSEKIYREENARDFWAVTLFQGSILAFLLVVFSLMLILA
jgi:hypothetical protein